MGEVRCKVRKQSENSSEFDSNKGLRQGDALECLLFNLVLEKVVRETGIQSNGTIFNRSVQLLGYADDLDIVARSFAALTESLLSLQRAAARMGRAINDCKTKYIYTGGARPQERQCLWESEGVYLPWISGLSNK